LSRQFDDPIPLPDGGKLVTLRDDANYIISAVLKALNDDRPVTSRTRSKDDPVWKRR
jgi:hypothetical protein